ncbi:MAG: hypothetical protein Q4G70_14585 [Pseudomonadota bacterium]|nr:hypothetical protein [Pseudomonadota bacterium]
MSAHDHLRCSRRQGLRALGALLLGGGVGSARAAGKQLPPSASLQAELARALKARQPLVVMVSLHRCPWCDEVRNNYLAPMHAQDGLHVVQVDMLSPAGTRTVQGEPVTHNTQVSDWGVKIAPTVLFLGPGGKEVADRLVGGSPDFYSAYLDNRLAQARRAVTAS